MNYVQVTSTNERIHLSQTKICLLLLIKHYVLMLSTKTKTKNYKKNNIFFTEIPIQCTKKCTIKLRDNNFLDFHFTDICHITFDDIISVFNVPNNLYYIVYYSFFFIQIKFQFD